MAGKHKIPIVVGQPKQREINIALKKQLQFDRCWTQKSSDILLSAPLVLFEFHRLCSAVNRLFSAQILLNPVYGFCPLCGKVLKLKHINCTKSLLAHLQSSHSDSENDYYVQHMRLLDDHHFVSKTYSKLLVTEEKNHEYFSFMLPHSLQTGDLHYLSFWTDILLKNDIIEPGSLIFQEIDAYIDMCQRFPHPTPPRWKFWPTLCGYVERLNVGFSRFSHKFYLGGHVIDKNITSQTATIEHLRDFTPTVNHAGPALSTVSSWKPALVLESCTHFLEIALHLKSLMACPECRPVLIRNEHVLR